MINLKNTILRTAVILAASLQLSAATLATSHGFDVESGIATISSKISGTGTIYKFGAGELNLTANNDHTLGSVIAAGTLSISNTSALGQASTIEFAGNGTLKTTDNVSLTTATINSTFTATFQPTVGTLAISTLSGIGGTMLVSGVNGSNGTGGTTVSVTNPIPAGAINYEVKTGNLALTAAAPTGASKATGGISVKAGAMLDLTASTSPDALLPDGSTGPGSIPASSGVTAVSVPLTIFPGGILKLAAGSTFANKVIILG